MSLTMNDARKAVKQLKQKLQNKKDYQSWRHEQELITALHTNCWERLRETWIER